MQSKNYKSNHALDLLTKLNNERKSLKEFCDIQVTTGTANFAGHKCVLGMFSTLFGKMFTCDMCEKSESKANIKGVGEKTMETVLDFIYTCDVTVTNENVYNLIEASNYMDIPHLKQFCIEFLLETVNVTNVVGIRAYAKSYIQLTENLDEITEKADCFIAENFEAVVKGEEFLETKFEEVKELFQIEEKEVSSEEVVYHAMMHWIKHDASSRQEHIANLFGFLKLEALPFNFLRSTVSKEEMVISLPACTKMCFQSMLNRDIAEKNFTGNVKFLQPGKIFIAINGTQVQSYNVARKEISSLPNLSNQHCNRFALRHNRKVFVIGGQSNAVDILDLDYPSWGWRPGSASGMQRNTGLAAVFGDSIYFYGSDSAVQTGERYDIYENRWKNVSILNEGRSHLSLVSNKFGVYAIGGATLNRNHHNNSQMTGVNTVEFLNFCNGGWNRCPPLRVPRYNLATVSLNDEIYAIGGRDVHGMITKSVEKFNPCCNTWSNVANLNVARGGHGACVVDGKIYVAGGGSQAVEVYDPDKDIWEVHSDIPSLQQTQSIVAV